MGKHPSVSPLAFHIYIFFSETAEQISTKLARNVHSSEARKQYDEYCLSIMQTITYAHDRTHFQGSGWIVPFDLREWN
jgi:hypothetical protein